MHLNLFSKIFFPLRGIILRNKLLFGKSYIKTVIKISSTGKRQVVTSFLDSVFIAQITVSRNLL